MTIKIGTRMTAHHQKFEVVSILANGGLRLRRVKDGSKSDGCQYDIGEVVRIVGPKGFLRGVISSVNPLRATITQGAMEGCSVGSGKVRKWKLDRK